MCECRSSASTRSGPSTLPQVYRGGQSCHFVTPAVYRVTQNEGNGTPTVYEIELSQLPVFPGFLEILVAAMSTNSRQASSAPPVAAGAPPFAPVGRARRSEVALLAFEGAGASLAAPAARRVPPFEPLPIVASQRNERALSCIKPGAAIASMSKPACEYSRTHRVTRNIYL